MQVLLAGAVLLALAGLGGTLALTGMICLLVRWARKRRSGRPGRGLAVCGGILLTLGVVCAAFPVGMFAMVRQGNLSIHADYRDTGRYVEEGTYQEHRFTVDGVVYVAADLTAGPGGRDGEPVFSYARKQTLLEKLMGYRECGNYNTVPNDAGLDLVTDSGISAILFCPEEQVEQVERWYGDWSRYAWYSSAYDDDGMRELTPLPELDAAHGAELETFCRESSGGEGEEARTVTVKEELRTIYLLPVSTDSAVEGEERTLNELDGSLYLQQASSWTGEERTYTLRPLPAELSEYLMGVPGIA